MFNSIWFNKTLFVPKGQPKGKDTLKTLKIVKDRHVKKSLLKLETATRKQ